nr:hypothetical protein [Tanacetum cinerariifolium]
MMIDCLSIGKTDRVNHTMEIDIVKLMVKIKSYGMSADELDKKIGSSDGLQPKQADLSCVHALNEPHLHEIHVVLRLLGITSVAPLVCQRCQTHPSRKIRAEIREEFRTSSGSSDAGGNPPLVTIHTWLESFNKQKPYSFEKAIAPVDTENWISHMEKIFDVIGCEDAFKTRLAVYKFEGNALAWWKAYKQAKGGDAGLITEYHSIRQTNTETSTEFMPRFLRLAGFLGSAAGTEEEQAKNFQWGLCRSTLNHLMCMSYTDVAQVANAARNYEILHETDDDDTERPDKRQKSGDQHLPTSQQSSHRNHGHNNDRHGSDKRSGGDNHRSNNNYSGRIPAMDVTREKGVISPTDMPILVPSSPGVPLRATLTQFALLVDVDTQESVVELLVLALSVVKLAIYKRIARRTPLQVDKKPGALGRVFAITVGHAANTSEIVDNSWIKHSKDQFYALTAQDMEILIQTCLMPLATKTQNDSFRFVHELKQEMHADLKYVESLEKEIDELESDKAESQTFWNEKASNVFRKEREHYVKIQELKAQLQDKNIAISELKKVIEEGKGKYVDTKFDKPSVVRKPSAQRIPKPSVLGKPAPFSNSFERTYFPKTKSVPKANVSEGLSKPITTQTLP